MSLHNGLLASPRRSVRSVAALSLIAAGLENSVGRSEDLLSRLLRDRFAFDKVLNVATAVLRACQSKRFTNQERDCFGLNFSKAPWYLVGVVDVGFRRMA